MWQERHRPCCKAGAALPQRSALANVANLAGDIPSAHHPFSPNDQDGRSPRARQDVAPPRGGDG